MIDFYTHASDSQGAMSLRCDGSAQADVRPVVTIDRSDAVERQRYRCPNGHINWDRTNSHIWCQSCSRASRQNAAIDPEHWEIVDEKTGETIAWDRVEVVE